MKRRIAYIGLSYPLFYDYRNPASMCENDIESSPNPILESPMGLLILYDELVFLCKSLCPDNMRTLPYVKFVDCLFPDLCLSQIEEVSQEDEKKLNGLLKESFSWGMLRHLMKLDTDRFIVDNHSHGLKIADITTSASYSSWSFAFDIGVFSFLKDNYDSEIEFVSNSMARCALPDRGNVVEFAEKIVVRDIPNYLSCSGPYHECMEELRESSNLVGFRKWIVENHAHITQLEIDDAVRTVYRTIQEKQDEVFMRYLHENSGYETFKSTGKTILKTTAGAIPIPGINLAATIWGLNDDLADCADRMDKMFDVQSIRWQGFIVESRRVLGRI